MVNRDIRACEAEGFAVKAIRQPDNTLVEAEITVNGDVIGLVDPCGPKSFRRDEPRPSGYYAVDADCLRLPGTFPTLLGACRALAEVSQERA